MPQTDPERIESRHDKMAIIKWGAVQPWKPIVSIQIAKNIYIPWETKGTKYFRISIHKTTTSSKTIYNNHELKRSDQILLRGYRVNMKENYKLGKYQLINIWNMKGRVVPVTVGVLGNVPKILELWWDKFEIRRKFKTAESTVSIGSARYRKGRLRFEEI